MQLKKILLPFLLMLTVLFSLLVPSMSKTYANKKLVTVPTKYRHNWYSYENHKRSGQYYKIGKHYAYFGYKHSKPVIKYKYTHLPHGWYGVLPVNGQF